MWVLIAGTSVVKKEKIILAVSKRKFGWGYESMTGDSQALRALCPT